MSHVDRSVWFVRHGNRLDFVDPNWAKSVDYPIDPPLAPGGVVQAQETAGRLKSEPIHHIFASPFLRTMETANAIAKALDLSVKVEPGLREMMLSEWFPKYPEVMSPEQLSERFSCVDDSYEPRCCPSWPETRAEAGIRCAQVILQLVQDFKGNLLIIGHGGTIDKLCHGLIPTGALDIHAALCCLIKLVCHDGQWKVELSGHDTSHLSQTEKEIRIF